MEEEKFEEMVETVQRLEQRLAGVFGLLMRMDESMEDIQTIKYASMTILGILIGAAISLLLK